MLPLAMVFSFLVTISNLGTIAAIHSPHRRHALRTRSAIGQECRVHLHNDEDVDVTMQFDVDGQNLRVIPDTGSFAPVLFSDECESCGARQRLLHTKGRHHLESGEHHAVQAYGSGQTFSVEAWAPAGLKCDSDSAAHESSVNNVTADKQMFWMTVKAALPVAQDSTFQGILGMGPPRSDAIVAATEAREVRAKVEQMKAAGINTSEYEPTVENMESVAEFAKTVKPWLQNTGVVTYSFCVGKLPGADGVLTLNDQAPDKMASAFVKIAADPNGIYWQALLSDVRLGDAQDDGGIRTEGSTQAILDTGTSLIGAPKWFAESVAAFVYEHLQELGCNDTRVWPSLSFKLGGQHFSLPGSSYVGMMEDGGEDSLLSHAAVWKRMPHLLRKSACTAMIFSTTDEGQQFNAQQEDQSAHDSHKLGGPDGSSKGDGFGSPEWILGLPFFKAYYTSFRLSHDSTGPRQLFVGQADANCQVVDPEVNAMRTVAQDIVPPTVIRPSKLRLPPRFVHQSGNNDVFPQFLEEGIAQA